MAYLSTPLPTKSNPLAGFFGNLFSALVRIAESNTRFTAVEKLQQLSDEELAAKGIRREDIVRHVYRDVLYI
ncbi:DUF1127 domain-containing protein [uncultured Pelagimonas sp.]|uniref:DUF1127 domain-containing protein n=1 Tax=uncultured Pelagimonas sp. TaxID=1618102 RepID=UPI00262555E1|nr:DUF1127 domain-containing protein [uncultured Pelagimonas sp.]